jgi:hypothetical protein
MKKILILPILAFFAIFLSSYNSVSTDNRNINIVKETKIVKTGEKYRVTAKTRNKYGQNYWVDLIVDGNVTSYSSSIYAVYYDDGYGLKQVTYYSDYEYKNSYYVFIDGNSYYFTF